MERLDDSNRIAESISQKKEQVDKIREEIKGEPKALKGMEKALLETLSQSEKKVMGAIEGKPTDVHKGIMEQMSIALKDQKKELADFRQDRKALGHDVRKLDPRLAKASNKLGKLENQAVKVEKLMPKSMAKSFKEESGRIMNKQHVVKQTQGQSKGVKVNTTIQKAMENQRTSAQSQRRTITTLQTKQAAIEHAAENRLKLANEIHKATKEIDHAIKNNEIAIKNSSPDLGWHLTVVNRNLMKQKESLELLGNELMTRPFFVDVNPSAKKETAVVGSQIREERKFDLTTEVLDMNADLKFFYGIRQNIESLTRDSSLSRDLRPDKSILTREGRVNDLGLRLSLFSSKSKDDKEIISEIRSKISVCNNKLNEYANAVLDYQNLKGQEKPGKIYGELEKLKSDIDNLKSELDKPLDQDNDQDRDIIRRLDELEIKFKDLSELNKPKLMATAANLVYIKPLEDEMTKNVNDLSKAIIDRGSKTLEEVAEKTITSIKKKNEFIREQTKALEEKKLTSLPEEFLNKMSAYEKIDEALEEGDLGLAGDLARKFKEKPAAVEELVVPVEEPVQEARDDSLVAKVDVDEEVDKLYSEVNIDAELEEIVQKPLALKEVPNGSYAIEANGELKTVFKHAKGIDLESALWEFETGALSFYKENGIKLPYFEIGGQYASQDVNGSLKIYMLPKDQKKINELIEGNGRISFSTLRESVAKAQVKVPNGSYTIEANGELKVVFAPARGVNRESAFREFVSGALSFFEENSVMLPYIEYNGQYAYHSPFGLRLVRPPEDQKQIDLLQSFGTKASITYVKEA